MLEEPLVVSTSNECQVPECLIRTRNTRKCPKFVLPIRLHRNGSILLSFTQFRSRRFYGLIEVNFGINFDLVAGEIYGLWGCMGYELDSSSYDSPLEALVRTREVNLKTALTPFSAGGIVTQNSKASSNPSAKTSFAFHVHVVFESFLKFSPPKVTLLGSRSSVCFDCGPSG
jgi:hypothetical protein